MTLSEVQGLIYSPKIQFFMYNGGAGGEFIIHQISKYSPKFQQIEFREINAEINRYQLDYPNFFYPIIFNQGVSYDTALDNTILDYANSNNIKLEPVYALLHNTRTHLLIRAHPYCHSYFTKNNAWFLSLDNRDVANYRNDLRIIKIYLEIMPNEILLPSIRQEYIIAAVKNGSREQERLEEFERYVNQHEVTNLRYIHLHLAAWGYDGRNTLSVNEIMNSSIDDLLMYIKPFLGGRPDNTEVNQLSYLELFNPSGQFQEEFKITDPSFYNEFVNWHLRNLELLKKYNFDTEKYQFHLN